MLQTECREYSLYLSHLIEPKKTTSSVERVHARNNILLKFFIEMSQHDYDDSWITPLRAGYDGPLGENPADDPRIFCSDSVARAYQHMELLPPGINTREITPVDFTRMQFLNEAYLKPPVLIADAGVEPFANHIGALVCTPCVLI